jgi:ornithine carbamoyltransferase
MKHFISLKDLSPNTICRLVERAIALKKMGRSIPIHSRPLDRRILAMLFTKRSTRTRVSAEAGWTLLGGHPSFFSQSDIQLGAGEPIQDTARVLSSMTDAILARLGPHEDILVRNSLECTLMLNI